MEAHQLLNAVNAICRQAGAAILAVYQADGDVDIAYKADNSPLTKADLAAHRIIVEALQALSPEWPVLSEESESIAWQERKQWQRYWLVDPLDGTKEFINRNGEFTVNIALIDKGEPILGVVYVPVSDTLYYGSVEGGAYKEEKGRVCAINIRQVNPQHADLKVVASRNHQGEDLDHWLQRATEHFAGIELLNMGSSLKICLVAEGKADIYPRLAPTCEWDTAAAQAVLEAAGGALTDAHHQPYRYNQKESLLNPYFFAIGDKSFAWREI